MCVCSCVFSLIQLWNCALQVIRDRFVESKCTSVVRVCNVCVALVSIRYTDELPSFQVESEHMSGTLQAHRVNLAAAQNLRYHVF